MKNRLKEVRQQKGISQLALSRLTGIAPGDIGKIESGLIKAWPGWRKRLSRSLGMKEVDIFGTD